MTQAAGYSTHDLSERLSYSQLDEKSLERIWRSRALIERELPVALDKFYANIAAIPNASRFFRDSKHVAHAKSAQISHWSSISAADFDQKYVQKVWADGHAHARVGFDLRWYVGGYAVILEHLVKAVVAASWPTRFWSNRQNAQAEELGANLASLINAVFLDMDLSISVYADAAERARVEGERRVKEQERELVASTIGAALKRVAAKDLTCRLTDDLPEAYLQLRNDFNDALDELQGALEAVWSSFDDVYTGARGISTASNDLALRTERQAASLEETAAALNEMTSAVHKAGREASDSQQTAAVAAHAAEAGEVVVQQAIEAMRKVERSSQQVQQIIGMIDELAFQTNLLALNAGVEAARAGQAAAVSLSSPRKSGRSLSVRQKPPRR